MRVIIYTHDPMVNLVYLPDEATEMFGDEHLEEYGVEVPDALALELKATYTKLLELSKQLASLKPD